MRGGKERSGTPRRSTASPYGSATERERRARAPRRERRDGQRSLPAARGAQRLGRTGNLCNLPLSKGGVRSASATLGHG